MAREYKVNNSGAAAHSSDAGVPAHKSLEEVRRSKEREKNKNRLIAACVLLIIIIAGIVLCYGKLFKIKRLVVSGECPYSEEEMLEGMGLAVGDTLYGKTEKEIKQNVKYKLAYIDNIEIYRIWPDTVKAKVEKANPTFYISIEDTMYVLSQSLRVLSKTDDIEKIELEKLVPLEIGGIKSCVEGEYLLADSNSEQIVKDLYDLLNEYEVFDEITYIDVTDRFDIRLTYGTKFTVKLGDKINLEPKIQFMLTIINEKSKDGSGGIVDVSDDEVKEGTFESYT